MRPWMLLIGIVTLVTGCDNFVPRPKTASYDPVSGAVILPQPCPDWSQSQVHNYLNETHSNFGCSVNTLGALQLAYPQDLIQGHGDTGPDMATSLRVLEDYRTGKIPAPLTPVQTGSAVQ